MNQINRLCLGTAKLGMPWYGLSSVSRPTHKDAGEIIRAACDAGIPLFDTGAAYGDAEDLLIAYGPEGDRCITKLAPDLADVPGCVRRRAEGWDFGTVLLHNPTVEQLRDPLLLAIAGLSCADGTRFGASVYEPAEARAAIAAGLKMLQVPYCVLDQRHHDVIAEAKAAGVTVFARQPFLQGLLVNFGGVALWDKAGGETATKIMAFRAICERFGIRPVEACLRFSLASAADYVVFGAGSVAHLQEVISIARSEPSPGWPDCYAELRETFADSAIELRSLWSK